MKKNILGLDLGTNSIGWAVIEADEKDGMLTPCGILRAGSRIIPMDAALQGDFEAGNSISQTGERTMARGMRRLYQRRALRRERMNRVLSILGCLPEHYLEALNRYGQIEKGLEPKLAWMTKEGKSTFLFQTSFEEMCEEFKAVHPEMFEGNRKIAYDWTIYYLRKKALSQPISGQELAWILLQANQKRGYMQARGEVEESKPTERKEYHTLKVIDVKDTGEQSKGRTWYDVVLENGWVYHRQSAYPLDWIGKQKNFIVTTKLNEDGTEALDKEGNVKRSFSAPNDDDWALLKIKTEHAIEQSGKTVGQFIYESLLHNPDTKIIGQLVRVVDRKLYREEYLQIVRKQMEFHPELKDSRLYASCIESLYPQNDSYRKSIEGKGFDYLLVDDILFYQRPLKSKKHLISECPHEFHYFEDKEKNTKRQYLKSVPKSHPTYEEFRVVQFVQNLAITPAVIYDKAELTDWLLSRKDVNMKQILEHLLGKKHNGYRWNYVEDKTFPMAPTRALLIKSLVDFGGEVVEEEILKLWHILYSVTDQKQLNSALLHYEQKHGLQEGFAEKLSKTKPFDSQYGAYSLKATQKLLALMREGEKWSWEAIDANTQNRIDNILDGVFDENISTRIREKCKEFTEREQFQALPLWFAEYVVYDLQDTERWKQPEDIDVYLHNFRQHSLNNPIVEQVVMETLRVVRDIWTTYGHIDEIHLELAREMKKTAEQRRQDLEKQKKNEAANMRARQMLTEMMNPDMGVSGVRGYSPSQLELYRIYESDVLASNKAPEDIQKIIDALASANRPSHEDVRKYRLWLDQKYRSPYTGAMIPLARLFTPDYEIEHVIPQARFFDDSMSNKVICESEVNKLKDKLLAHEFINSKGGSTVVLSGGRTVEIMRLEAYEQLVKDVFASNKGKLEKLMLDDIPEKFINRQLNDSRYISRLMKSLLSNIVRVIDPKTGKPEVEETSRNLIVCSGKVTDTLKTDWGINDVWNHIILPRFERMNELQDTDVYTKRTANGHIIPNMPTELSPNFSKKRIDHRHHAMDAIVIACTTRSHVNLLNNESANDRATRYDLQYTLRERKKWIGSDGKERESFGLFFKPWDTFTQDVEDALRDIVVSHKQNLRVINKTVNHYVHYDGNGKKVVSVQTKGDSWAIRKSLHKETGFGLVNLHLKRTANFKYALAHVDDIVEHDLRLKLRELLEQGYNERKIKKYFDENKDVWSDVNLSKIEVWYYSNDSKDRYYASRVPLGDSFDEKTIREKVADEGIQKILLAWLNTCDGDPKQAFSPDGVEKMNANIRMLNGGVPHKPVYRVRKYEKADKFAVGASGAKSKKFVEAAKGTNLFSAIYVTTDTDGHNTRSYFTLPLKFVVQCQKDGGKDWKTLMDTRMHDEGLVTEDARLLCLLSPGDLVYVPTADEIATGEYKWDKERIYKMVSCTGGVIYFISSSVASILLNKVEFSPTNKMERAITGEMIKEICVPIRVDRLGNISPL